MAKMISVDEAQAILIKEAGRGERAEIELSEAHAHYLAEDARADRDFPPFDRAMVDGFALRTKDIAQVPADLAVIEDVPAGRAPQQAVGPGQATRIMTGAPVPQGADAVVMIEHTKPGGARVTVERSLEAEANIARRGSDRRQGATVIAAGMRIGPAETGVLASVGYAKVPVFRKPHIAILGSGDELVEPGAQPKPWQIRNSNSYQLLAQAASHGLSAEYLGVAPDEAQRTRRMVEEGLACDVLITTGGVSVGDKDFIGAAFADLGVEILFDKIAVKPGKPTAFGRRGGTLVFGLPGNPVAALTCFHLFVMTAVRARMGAAEPLPARWRVPLKGSRRAAGDRPTFVPARLEASETGLHAVPNEWHGSGDLCATVQAAGFVRQGAWQALADGDAVDFFPLTGA
ncbi:MAG: molybdopterin molybdotransferase MoeA [Planctomycetes bacterium]|nr:molybdopterin molybdotransferase MoeA [Planctomycetota bacterium]